MDNVPDILAAITPIMEAFEELGIPYHLGGSVASSLHGLPRLNIDVTDLLERAFVDAGLIE